MAHSIYIIFLQALHVMNVALQENQYSPLHQLVIEASEADKKSQNLVVEVYGDDSSDIRDQFTIALRQSRFVLIAHGRRGEKTAWKVSEEYLHDVAENPEKYIDYPARLDFDWLRDRVGGCFPSAPRISDPEAKAAMAVTSKNSGAEGS